MSELKHSSLNKEKKKTKKTKKKKKKSKSDQNKTTEKSEKLHEVIAKVLKKKPLQINDYNDFSVVPYLNKLLPSQEELPRINSQIRKVKNHLRNRERIVLETIKHQAESNGESREIISEATSTIFSLSKKITEIKTKAQQSKTVVNKICKNLKKLDSSKKNLTTSIKLLEQLRSLIKTTDELPILIGKNEYSKMPELICELKKSTEEFELIMNNQKEGENKNENENKNKNKKKNKNENEKKNENENQIENENKKKNNFKKNAQIEKLIEVSNTLQKTLRKNIINEFETLLPKIETSEESKAKLKECCLVVDSLGIDFRREIVYLIYTYRLKDYIKKFSPSQNKNNNDDLNKLDQRSIWLEREFRYYNRFLAGVLPKYWRVSMKLSEQFVMQTRNDIDNILKNEEEKLTSKIWVSSLSLFHSLEDFLTKKFSNKIDTNNVFNINDPDFLYQNFSDSSSSDNDNKNNNKFDEMNQNDSDSNSNSNSNSNSSSKSNDLVTLPRTALAIKEKYQKIRKEKERKERKELKRKLKEIQNKKLEELEQNPLEKMKLFQPKPIVFKGAMTGGFEQFGNVYIDKERERLNEAFGRITKEENFELNFNKRLKKLKSCSEIFLVIRKNFDKTFALSKGSTFLNMFNLYKQIFIKYSDFLFDSLPKYNTFKSFSIINPKKKKAKELGKEKGEKTEIEKEKEKGEEKEKEKEKGEEKEKEKEKGSGKSQAQSDYKIEMTNDQFENVSCIINTCEYAYGLAEQLYQSVSKQINEKYKNKIEIDQTLDHFIKTINRSVAILVAGIETKLEPFIIEMKNTKWFSMTIMGDQSNFVTQIGSVISEIIPLISHYLSDNYFKFFCNKLINDFVPRFSNCIYQLRKIQGVGGSQLLMDMQLVKQILINIPSLRRTHKGEKFRIFRTYEKYINKELAKVEIALKVSMVSKDDIVNTYLNMTQKNGSEEDLVKILEMSGLNKSTRQSKLLDYQKLFKILINENSNKSSQKNNSNNKTMKKSNEKNTQKSTNKKKKLNKNSKTEKEKGKEKEK
ncbi:vacuolar protein sorting-associated protein [Anaeramoeba flamelloides]|uniref:Vacuolar protein sorting-associated protein n=1 Tax=Anaeramoeba flamelloides TaxID=1746091 RepID=A0ABQ8ZDZ7_9EUKA|nr:vacuolar protein sorting-associated protein [Anaeramoeba flamelloides]